MKCPSCAWPAAEGDAYCVSCGALLPGRGTEVRWDALPKLEELDKLPGHEHGRHRAED